MITGAHAILYSRDAERDRAFLRDVLELPNVDAGHGWLIFALPPAEAAFHPSDGEFTPAPGAGQLLGTHVYLMCDDVQATVKALATKNVRCSEISTERWGIKTTIPLPSGGAIGLYQPTHPTAI